MAKSKHTIEGKISIATSYLSGEGSYREIATSSGIDAKTVRNWVRIFQKHGAAGFYTGEENKCYSKEFKIKCVETVLVGNMSINEAVATYRISSDKVLRDWIKCYNANIELKDYEPKREVYMAEARRKTTLEERKEIVDYCISHNNDYKGTASRYEVSYSQVYSWVKKYRENGEDGLEDKRGHHKTDEEVDELERLRRENKRLKKQLEERDMLCELLKKVRDLEGM